MILGFGLDLALRPNFSDGFGLDLEAQVLDLGLGLVLVPCGLNISKINLTKHGQTDYRLSGRHCATVFSCAIKPPHVKSAVKLVKMMLRKMTKTRCR